MNSSFRLTEPDTISPGGDGIEVGSEEARGSSMPHMTRYIPGWGLFFVIVAFLVILGVSGFVV